MKKTLLLSVVASTMIMAGGDIAPVEPIVVPVVESGWKFDGNMVAYYQTRDTAATDLFGTDASQNNFGIQLRAVNDDLFWGVGAGFEVTGLASLRMISDRATGAIQTAGNYDNDIGGAFTQAYLTYNIDMIDTGLKIGRQTLPKALSPFAFSESWSPVKNTFDAALVVNSSIPDTTLVYAFVDKANQSFQALPALTNLDSFNYVNGNLATDNGIHMITAQNKSIEGLTLTGSFYYAQDMLAAQTVDVMIGWGDAKFNYDGYSIGLQGGTIMVDTAGTDTIAYGAKIGAKFNLFDTDFTTCVAYSAVDEGTVAVANRGGVKTPLYTQMILNQGNISSDATAIVGKVGADVLGGHFGVAFAAMTDEQGAIIGSTADSIELDVTYKTKITENTTLFAAYVMTDADTDNVTGVDADAQNFVRVWARYNFN